jgi:predicted alpha-1,2-mannosidase
MTHNYSAFYSLAFFLLAFISACTPSQDPDTSQSFQERGEENRSYADYSSYVNPFIGTKNMGHTYPGATVPFGMVQATPLTNYEPLFEDGQYNPDTYRYCSGYQYDDSLIFGFCHTSFSGTGHSDLGDIVLMPTTGKLNLSPKTNGQELGFSSSFKHKNELASPGYYAVSLDDYNVDVQITATERAAYHQYDFHDADTAHVLLDLVSNIYDYDEKNVWTFLRVENDTLVTGYRQTKGWARTRLVYFAIAFSEPIANYGHEKYDKPNYNGFYRRFDEKTNFPEMAGEDIRAWFDFDLDGKQLGVKVALSSVSTAGATLNLQTELPHWKFEETKAQAADHWNRELNKIQVEMVKEADLTTFYTALYHSMLSPIIYEDVDGKYRGLDQNIHESTGFTNYTIFSLWDTYRALHPLNNLIQPDRNNDMIHSMLAHYDQSAHDMLPIWSHYANENWCMIGYHATSVIADAMAKNVGDFDRQHALEACLSTSTTKYFDGIGEYMEFGYVPEDVSGSSVSKTLEFAYNDWCIAQIAHAVGDTQSETEYLQRSEFYANCYDPGVGFMRPKLADGSWKTPFDPMDTHGQGFIEGNAWNYGLYVPHDIDKMIEMMGGKEQFAGHLDSLFTMEIADEYIAQNEDITRDGIIGNYVQGNEPGHHIPYLYNWTGHPEKTQERVRMIMDSMYGPNEDGLCGNDDAGQMSAWYVLSALGFYDVAPGTPFYAVGSPLVKSAFIDLSNGHTLEIRANNQGPENVYIESLHWNGEPITNWQLDHREISKGGVLEFDMTDRQP